MRCNRVGLISVSVFVLLCNSPILVAGPLDRTDMGPRVNPATNDMLRVPGVVGMDSQGAMATLQQAGLNPRLHAIHKTLKKYAGQEGMVIKQLPLAGGMAMLGSSVSITVYVPGNTPVMQNPPASNDLQTPDMNGGDTSSPDMGDSEIPPSNMGGGNMPSPGLGGEAESPDVNSNDASSPDLNENAGQYPAVPGSDDEEQNMGDDTGDTSGQSVPPGTNWGASGGSSATATWRPSGHGENPDIPKRQSRPEGQKYLLSPDSDGIEHSH
jgi:hypothetical protein